MQLNLDVPFVGNEADDLHCYSASLTMILGHFVPEMPLVIEVGNRISQKPEHKAAWPISAPLWLQLHGFQVSVIFDFDYQAVAAEGIDYIKARYGAEVAAYQTEHTDVPDTQTVEQFLSEVSFERRIPELVDIENALESRRLVAVTVNHNRLKGEDGYMNHSVVVKGILDGGLILHNPGLPPEPDQYVTIERFLDAWSFPSEDARYMMAVGRSTERELDVDAVLAVAQAKLNERTE